MAASFYVGVRGRRISPLNDVQQPQDDNEAQRHAEQPQNDRHFSLPVRSAGRTRLV